MREAGAEQELIRRARDWREGRATEVLKWRAGPREEDWVSLKASMSLD